MPELELRSLAYGGDAVGQLAGKVVFVPLGAPGDRARIKIVKEHASYSRAELVEVLAPGPGRRAPPCTLFGRCGGCQWQHVSYPVQAEAKHQILQRALASVDADVLPLGEAPAELGYRRRIRAHWRVGADGVALGFLRRGSDRLLDVDRCPLLAAPLQQGFDVGRRALQVARDCSGTLVAVAGETGEVHVSVRVQRRSRRARVRMATLLSALQRPPVVGGQVQLGHRTLAFGAQSVECGEVHGSAAAFIQANPDQDRRLRELAHGWAGARGLRVLELFAGVGNLTRGLAAAAREVVAVESAPAATRLLERNVQGPLVPLHRSAESAVEELARRGERFDVVVLNPPREGCVQVAERLGELGVARVVYVSCDPMTLARDLGVLGRQGLRVERAQGLDMMPQTFHVETVVLLAR
jgi:23S rRNA (uracil1939-C5)-methyltransferase